MRTFRTFGLSAILFMAMFFGQSYTCTVSAQSGNQLIDVIVDEINSQPQDDLQSSGIISMKATAEGSLLKIVVILNEDDVPVSMYSALIDGVKTDVKENKYKSTAEEIELFSIFDEAGISFQYVLMGNNSGTVLKKDVSYFDILALSKLSSFDGDVYANMPVEELVELMNKGMKSEDGSCGCVLKGRNVAFEIEYPKNEYDAMRQIADSDPELLSEFFNNTLLELLDADGRALLDSIKKRGYSLGVSIKCGKNVPIYISLD